MPELTYEPYYTAVLIDCGRGYFSVDQIKRIIDKAAASHYKYLMLGFGNDGLRFLLDDMTLEVVAEEDTAPTTINYDSDIIKAAIIRKNDALAPLARGQWTQSEMDGIISYATDKDIEIIPMLDNPGHASSITEAMIASGLTDAAIANRNDSGDYGSVSYDLIKPEVTAFAKAFIGKYIAYFAEKGCHHFNLAMDEYAGCLGGWPSLDEKERSAFVAYTQELVQMVLNAGMTPMAFCDVIGYAVPENPDAPSPVPSELIGINWNGEYLRNHRNVNANYNWYYVLGATGEEIWCGYEKAIRHAACTKADTPITEKRDNGQIITIAPAPEAAGAGCIFAVWNDKYLPAEEYMDNICEILKILADNNPQRFA